MVCGFLLRNQVMIYIKRHWCRVSHMYFLSPQEPQDEWRILLICLRGDGKLQNLENNTKQSGKNSTTGKREIMLIWFLDELFLLALQLEKNVSVLLFLLSGQWTVHWVWLQFNPHLNNLSIKHHLFSLCRWDLGCKFISRRGRSLNRNLILMYLKEIVQKIIS